MTDSRYDYFCWAPDKGSAKALLGVLEGRGLVRRRRPYRMEDGGYGVHVGGPVWYRDPSLARHAEVQEIAEARGCAYDGGGVSFDLLAPEDYPDEPAGPDGMAALSSLYEARIMGDRNAEETAARVLDATRQVRRDNPGGKVDLYVDLTDPADRDVDTG